MGRANEPVRFVARVSCAWVFALLNALATGIAVAYGAELIPGGISRSPPFVVTLSVVAALAFAVLWPFFRRTRYTIRGRHLEAPRIMGYSRISLDDVVSASVRRDGVGAGLLGWCNVVLHVRGAPGAVTLYGVESADAFVQALEAAVAQQQRAGPFRR